MKRTRKPKPRPTYVLEALIADLVEQRRTVMRKYTVQEYDRRRDLDRRIAKLQFELMDARDRYLPKDTGP